MCKLHSSWRVYGFITDPVRVSSWPGRSRSLGRCPADRPGCPWLWPHHNGHWFPNESYPGNVLSASRAGRTEAVHFTTHIWLRTGRTCKGLSMLQGIGSSRAPSWRCHSQYARHCTCITAVTCAWNCYNSLPDKLFGQSVKGLFSCFAGKRRCLVRVTSVFRSCEIATTILRVNNGCRPNKRWVLCLFLSVLAPGRMTEYAKVACDHCRASLIATQARLLLGSLSLVRL